MKKLTILFATWLATSVTVFGQKEGKVLWENSVDTISSDVYVSAFPDNLASSPSGNILVQYKYYNNKKSINKDGVKLYDQHGKLLWDIHDFYQKRSTNIYSNLQNKDYALVSYFIQDVNGYGANDSTLYLNKDFSPLRKFEVQKANSFLITVENGVFYNENGKTLVKYNVDGKEEWRYDYDYPINILTTKSPYIGLVFSPTEKREMLIFDKNGKKIGSTEPQSFREILPTKDKGFWLVNKDFEYIKYDSTGKQTAKYLYQKEVYNYTSPIIFADNSILITFNVDNQIILVKVSPSGSIVQRTILSELKLRDYSNPYAYKIIESQNKVMYSLRLLESQQEAEGNYRIGVVDFDNLSASWSKNVKSGISNGITGNAFTFEKGNTFFQVYSRPDNASIKSFRIYDVNGTLKWESPFVINSPRQNIIGWRIMDSFLYTKALYPNGIEKSGLVKVSCVDGNTVWKKEDVDVYNYAKDIQKDRKGNEIILYNKNNKFKLGKINLDGSDKWVYSIGESSNIFYAENIFFATSENEAITVLTQEVKNNTLRYILRKISPCEDLNALTITGKTEACPTEKVKLSVPKQEGITYQWQKDGKDIPNIKDLVYDFGESGTYTVVAKDEFCQNTVISNALKINIRNLPNTEITAPKSTFCDGEKTTITSKTNGTFFQWQKDGKDIPNATSGIYEVSQTGDYRVGVRDDKCPQVGYSNTYAIVTKLLPEATISTDIKGVVYEPFTVKMSANSGTNLAYQWLKDDVIIPNETKLNYEAKKSGKYNVIVTQEGCEKRSDALTISILIPLVNSEEIGEEQVQVYPNPNKGTFKIILPKSLKSADVQLFDTYGRERSLVYAVEQVQAEGLTQGVYFVRISKGEKTVTSKLVIE